MAGELVGYGSNATHDFFCFNAANEVWNGSTFETWSDGNYTTYRVTATQQGTSGRFVGNIPDLSVTRYELRIQAGTLSGSYTVWESEYIPEVQLADNVIHGGNDAKLHLGSNNSDIPLSIHSLASGVNAVDIMAYVGDGSGGKGLYIVGEGNGAVIESINDSSVALTLIAGGAASYALDIRANGVGSRSINVPNSIVAGNSGNNITGVSLTSSTITAIKTAIEQITVEPSITASADLTNDADTQLTSINLKQAIALVLAAVAAQLSGAEGTDIVIKQAGKPTGNTRIAATVDDDGNRTALTLKVPT